MSQGCYLLYRHVASLEQAVVLAQPCKGTVSAFCRRAGQQAKQAKQVCSEPCMRT